MIGKKAGWMKVAKEGDETVVDGKKYIEIGGKLFDEDLNESTLPEVPLAPKSKSALGITFTEGEEYENWFGVYKVLRIIDDKMMEVEYLSAFKPDVRAGEVKRYPILAQAETIRNALKQTEAELARAVNLNAIVNFTQPDEFFTLGYMASHGYISAEIGPKYHKQFPLMFKKMTGESPDAYLGSGYKMSNNDNRWSYTLRAKFPSPPPDIGEKLKLPNNHIIRPKSGVEINDNAFIWGLFRMGFRPGKNNDRSQQILSNIPASARDMFMAGFSI